MLFSHIGPDKELSVHLAEVGQSSKKIVLYKNLKTKLINKRKLADISYILGVTHDFGKATGFFQKKLKHEINSEESKHGLISALFTYNVLKEFLDDDNIFPILGFMIVKKHHGNLENLEKSIAVLPNKKNIILEQLKSLEKNLGELRIIYRALLPWLNLDGMIRLMKEEAEDNFIDLKKEKFELENKLEEMNIEENIELFLLVNFLFSCLIDTDKKSAAGILNLSLYREIEDINFVDFYLKKISQNRKELRINKLRDEFYACVVKNKRLGQGNFYSVTAPTGIGKTLAGYSAALKLKNMQKRRIIYCLPFTAIIDQTHSRLKEVLIKNLGAKEFFKNESSYLLKHHYLAEKKIISEELEKYSQWLTLNDLLLTENWESTNVVSTFLQLFHSIIGYKNKFLKKFHNIVNSIIILDEPQNIPLDYWVLIEKIFMVLAERFDTKIIFMTATQPYIFNKDKTVELSKADFMKHELTERNVLKINKKARSLDEFLRYFLKNFNKEIDRYLFVLNTRKSAIELFKKLKGTKKLAEYKKISLTNNLIPKHREEKIEEINKFKGKIMVVSTQLIEAGVDIDFDYVYRDFAPLDSIIQTAGRCNRHGIRGLGTVEVVTLVNDKEKRFADFIYDYDQLEFTKEVLEKNSYKNSEFAGLVNDFFSKCERKRKSEKILNAIKHLDYEDDEETELVCPISKFRLIQKEPYLSEVFVPFGVEGKAILSEYKNLLKPETKNIDAIKKFEKLVKLKPKIRRYVVLVNNEELNKTPVESLQDNLYYLDLDSKTINSFYNREIGITFLDNIL